VTPLHIAVSNKNHLMVKHLLDEKAEPNAIAADGDSPLSRACGRGYTKIVNALLQNKGTEVGYKKIINPLLQNKGTEVRYKSVSRLSERRIHVRESRFK
jgi:ankyrin repeat protein